MLQTSSPLESLAAFAIVLVASVLSTLGMAVYIQKVKRDASNSAREKNWIQTCNGDQLQQPIKKEHHWCQQ